jgi:hypothetical protein
MKKCYNSINILNIITDFLECPEIAVFSLTDTSLYSYLNPENNAYINSRYRDASFKKYFNINNKKNYELNFLNLDDYKETKNNWKNILKKIYINSQIYPDKIITDEIYNSFNCHYYMPYQRMENKILEYEYSTMHQTFCYDIQKNNFITSNYYNKYFEDDKNDKIEPFRKGLFFEQELINLKSEIKIDKNKNIINLIMNYSYEKLDNIYCSNLGEEKKNKKSKNFKLNTTSNVIFFLLWLNHTFILFMNLLYNYIFQFKNFRDVKKIIVEYSKIHKDLINFGLMINEKFNNINIMFNYINYIPNKIKEKPKNNFKIYNMFLNIMEKNFYQKLKPLLNNNIAQLINLAYKENMEQEKLNNTYDSNNNETNNTEVVNEENETDDYLYDNIDEIEDNENESENDEDSNDSHLTYKDIIDEYSNLILDFSINQDNCIYINSSKIKLNDCYNEYENIFIETISKNYENLLSINLNENEKSLDDEEINTLNNSYSFIKKITGKDGDYHLINRIKFNLLKKMENIIFNSLNKLINKEFIYNLKNINKEHNNFIYKDNSVNSVNNSCAFNNKYYNKYYNNIVYESYLRKLDDIKNNLIEKNTNSMCGEEIKDAAYNYIFSNDKQNTLMALSKDIILFFCNQINLYNNEDAEIIDYLFKKEENKESKSFK